MHADTLNIISQAAHTPEEPQRHGVQSISDSISVNQVNHAIWILHSFNHGWETIQLFLYAFTRRKRRQQSPKLFPATNICVTHQQQLINLVELNQYYSSACEARVFGQSLIVVCVTA